MTIWSRKVADVMKGWLVASDALEEAIKDVGGVVDNDDDVTIIQVISYRYMMKIGVIGSILFFENNNNISFHKN